MIRAAEPPKTALSLIAELPAQKIPTKTGRELEEKARFIANKTLKEALQGLTLEELKVSQDVLRKIFTNTKD